MLIERLLAHHQSHNFVGARLAGVPFSGVLAAAEDDDAVGPFEKVAQIAVDEDDALAGEFSATGSAK